MALIAAVAPRRLSSWIENFVERTAYFPSPEIFRLWSAIAAVAGALERKVWVHTAGDILFPNLYVVLVGPPGIGKTIMLTQVERLWRELPELYVAPTSITRASLVDSLAEAKRKVVNLAHNPPITEFNSLQIVSGELGVLIPSWDNEFMNTLTAIYDGAPYDERRRTAKLHLKIDKPQLNILAGTTPSYLHGVMPEGAWDQGFISRTLMIYSGEVKLIDIFADRIRDERDDLISDLKSIFALQGKMVWANEARDLVRDWHMRGGDPKPDHSKLKHYNARRTAHLIKLCIIACASRSNDKLINQGDVGAAFTWLEAAEAVMGDIFLAISSGGDQAIIEDAHMFLSIEYTRTKAPIPEYVFVNKFLKNRVPSHNIMRMIEVMLRSHLIKPESCPTGVAYLPLRGS